MAELVAASSAFDPTWPAASTGARQAALPRKLRRLHQAVLRHFVDTGSSPSRDWLHARASELGLDPRVASTRLTEADLVHLDDAGLVSVAYPFSGAPRGHRVALADGPLLSAMCAIDALGVPQMTGRDATITAADPSTGEPIRVDARGGHWRWSPQSAVVLVAGTRANGPSALCTCGHVNYYTRAEQAQAYLDAHPDLTGRVLDQAAAVELAGVVFGGLLRVRQTRLARLLRPSVWRATA
jgi:hypothetical protein